MKHSLNIVLLYGCSVIDLAVTKSTIFTKRALKIVCDRYNSKFEELLTMDDSVTIYHQNIQTLAIEKIKIHNEFSEVSISGFVS